MKPDVVAPGMLIASARSNGTAERISDPDPFHRILAGTSMAAPHVAGVVALMFQYAPNLQATALPTILRQTARLDLNTGLMATGSPVWGFGKVDARTATGLFRLTLVPNGIPDGIKVQVQIDNTNELNATSDSWLDIYFAKGTTHTIALETLLKGENEASYRLTNVNFIATSATHQTVNYTAGELMRPLTVEHTGYLIADYEAVLAPNPIVLILPSIVLLVLGIVAVALGLELYAVNKRKRKEPGEND
jgi:hypothetical protein